MTQRKWTTVDGWSVLTGWDRPLQHFFVNIDRECGGCDGEGIITDATGGPDGRNCTTCDGQGIEFLYDNLADQEYTDAMGGMSIEQVHAVLDLKLTAYPQNIMWDLLNDKAKDVGNYVQDYGVIGEEKDGNG